MTISLTAGELDSILTKTNIAKTKKLRPRLEAMAAEGKPIELDVYGVEFRLVAAMRGKGEGRIRLQAFAGCFQEDCWSTGPGIGDRSAATRRTFRRLGNHDEPGQARRKHVKCAAWGFRLRPENARTAITGSVGGGCNIRLVVVLSSYPSVALSLP